MKITADKHTSGQYKFLESDLWVHKHQWGYYFLGIIKLWMVYVSSWKQNGIGSIEVACKTWLEERWRGEGQLRDDLAEFSIMSIWKKY